MLFKRKKEQGKTIEELYQAIEMAYQEGELNKQEYEYYINELIQEKEQTKGDKNDYRSK